MNAGATDGTLRFASGFSTLTLLGDYHPADFIGSRPVNNTRPPPSAGVRFSAQASEGAGTGVSDCVLARQYGNALQMAIANGKGLVPHPCERDRKCLKLREFLRLKSLEQGGKRGAFLE